MAVDKFHSELLDQQAISRIVPKLNFRPVGYLDTQEVKYPLKAHYNGLLFMLIKINEDKFKLSIEGSLHHYYNLKYYDKEQNFDDFTIFTMFTVLLELEEFLECDLENFEIRSFEFGVNIRCGKLAKLFLNKIRYFDIKYGVKKEVYANQGLMMSFEPTQFILKIYDKSRESHFYKSKNLNSIDDLIRFEKKYLRSRKAINETGIITLKDFLDIEKITTLFNVLQNHWGDILMEDTLEPLVSFSKKDLETFQKGVTHDFFSDPLNVNYINQSHKKTNTTKNINLRRKRFYKKYIELLDLNKLRLEYHEFTPALKEKCDFLLNPDNHDIEIIMGFMYQKQLNLENFDLNHIISGLRKENLHNSKSDTDLIEMIREAQERLHQKGL
ncbi:MAG: hypothetical protein IPG79_08540 [Saprospiraceae bacterium]|nr:hypothetical protein [Saprospiraceae bacterium]